MWITTEEEFRKEFGPSAKFIVGEKFNRLTVVAMVGRNRFRALLVAAKCECGTFVKSVRSSSLVQGSTISCGCYMREKNSRLGFDRIPAGEEALRSQFRQEFGIWRAIRRRCYDPNHSGYDEYYGGPMNWVKMYHKWRNSFAAFLKDVGPRPSPNHVMGRDGDEGPYAPWNAQWITKEENWPEGMGTLHPVTFNGQTQLLSAWAVELGMPRYTLTNRITKLGWSIERALTTPFKKCRGGLSEEDLIQAERLLKEGLSYQEVAVELGYRSGVMCHRGIARARKRYLPN